MAAAIPSAVFVRVHNADRSQMAAGFLREYAGDRIEVPISVRVIRGEIRDRVRALIAELV